MKKLLIILLLGLTTISISASSYDYEFSFIEVVNYEQTVVTEGITYEHFDFISSNNANKAFHASLDPSHPEVEMVLHDLFLAPGEFRSATLTQIAQDYEAQTGRKVYAAVNGDFFWNSAPIDYYIKEGHVWQEGYHDEKEAFGFNNHGDTALGTPELDTILRVGNHHFSVDRFGGQPPYPGELAIYTPGQNMYTIESSKYLVRATQVTKDNAYALPLYGELLVSEDSYLNDEAIVVPGGHFGIVFNGMNDETEQAEAFHDLVNSGMGVSVLSGPVGEFEGIDYVIGGNNILVENGEVMPYALKTSSAGEYWQPRTSIGIKEDGSFFISVIDGRESGYASGLTVPQQAQFAKELGAVSALELDGGGSSTFLLRIDDVLTVVNRPSDGSERYISNAVLFVEAEEEMSGEPDDNQGETPPADTIPNNDDDGDEPSNDDNESYRVFLLFGAIVLLFGGTVFIMTKKPI